MGADFDLVVDEELLQVGADEQRQRGGEGAGDRIVQVGVGEGVLVAIRPQEAGADAASDAGCVGADGTRGADESTGW